jgi:hypothetical protein
MSIKNYLKFNYKVIKMNKNKKTFQILKKKNSKEMKIIFQKN